MTSFDIDNLFSHGSHVINVYWQSKFHYVFIIAKVSSVIEPTILNLWEASGYTCYYQALCPNRYIYFLTYGW